MGLKGTMLKQTSQRFANHFKRTAFVSVCLVLLAGTTPLLSGCATTMNEQNKPAWAEHLNHQGRGLEILDVKEWKDPKKGTQLQIVAKSTAVLEFQFDYRVLWFTAEGQLIESLQGKWQTRTILPEQTIQWTEHSPRPNASSYKIEIFEK